MQELLAMVPSPVVAVIMLFPVTDKSKAIKQEGVLMCCKPRAVYSSQVRSASWVSS